jgi:hypothetical protein
MRQKKRKDSAEETVRQSGTSVEIPVGTIRPGDSVLAPI